MKQTVTGPYFSVRSSGSRTHLYGVHLDFNTENPGTRLLAIFETKMVNKRSIPKILLENWGLIVYG